MNSIYKDAGSEWLKDRGFNLLQVLDTARLTEELVESLIELGVEIRKSPRLVLLGMGGPDLWNRVKNDLGNSPDPFDDDAVSSVHTAALEFWGCTEVDLRCRNSVNSPAGVTHRRSVSICIHVMAPGLHLGPCF